MNSNDSVQAWKNEWLRAGLLQVVSPDVQASRRRLDLADRNVVRSASQQKAGDDDAALIFAEQALINAADALLARDGLSASSHIVRFRYPLLPDVYSAERGLIDQIRRARNAAQYDAEGGLPSSLSAEAIRIATKAVAEVRRLVGTA